MKIVGILRTLIAIFILALLSSCSSGSNASGPVTPSAVPVGIEFLNGATGVDTDASFQYTFSSDMDSSTVNSSTFFVVIGVDANIAVPKNKALNKSIAEVCSTETPSPGTVTNPSGDKRTFVLDPDAKMPYSTSITVCNLPADFSASFTTAAEGETPSRLLSSIEVNDSAVDLNDLPITSLIKVTFAGPEAALSDVRSLVTVTSHGNNGGAVDGLWQTLNENGIVVEHTSSLYFQFTPELLAPYCDRVEVVVPNTLISVAENTTFTTLYSYASPFTATDLRQNFSTCWSARPVAQGGGTFPGVVNENGLFGLNFSTAEGNDTDPNYGLNHVPMLDVDNALFTALIDNFAISGVATGGGMYFGMSFLDSETAQTPLVIVTFGVIGNGQAQNGTCIVWVTVGNGAATEVYNGPGNNNECLLNDPDPTMNLRFELVGTTLNMYAAKSCTTNCDWGDPIPLNAPYPTPLDLSQYGYDADTGYYTLSLIPYFLTDDLNAYISLDVVSISFE